MTTILLGTGATLEATIDETSIEPWGICGFIARATTRGGQIIDVAKLHSTGKWCTFLKAGLETAETIVTIETEATMKTEPTTTIRIFTADSKKLEAYRAKLGVRTTAEAMRKLLAHRPSVK